METETQRNFKKQMAELKKQREQSKDDMKVSYVDRGRVNDDFIFQKPKRRRSTRTASWLLSILIFGAVFVKYILPLIAAYPASNGESMISTSMPNPLSSSFYNQERIAEITDKLNSYQGLISDMTEYINTEVQSFSENYNYSEFIAQLEVYRDDISRYIKAVDSLDEPRVMNEYKSMFLESMEKYNEYLELMSAAIEEKDNAKFKMAVEKLKEFREHHKDVRDALCKLFEKTGISYTIEENGSIVYTYKKTRTRRW